jgi:hypothetical protein
MEEDEDGRRRSKSAALVEDCGRREKKKIYEYNIEWEVNSASQCIGKNCSLPREWKREGKLLWCSFYDFFKIFPKM